MQFGQIQIKKKNFKYTSMVQKTMQQNAVTECKLEMNVKPRPQILEVHRFNKSVPTDYTG
jgi:hypothetical protein